MGLYKKFVNQTRKPEGVLGKMMLNGMNSGHAKVADWGMDHLYKDKAEAILDIGCGGGRNAGELLKRYPMSHVTAVDYSPLSVAKASEHNKKAVDAGRCVCKQGDASALPVEADQFDLATAFETIYFWPGLEKCFAEVFRALKTGGVFLIVNESDGMDETTKKFENIIDGMKAYTEEQIREALTAAIIIILAALLVAFAIYNTIKKARGKSKSSCCGTPEVKTVKKVSDTDESHYPFRYEVGIGGMHCSNCARTVENQLNSMEGVWANVDLGKNRALVRAKQELTREALATALSENSYTLSEYKKIS